MLYPERCRVCILYVSADIGSASTDSRLEIPPNTTKAPTMTYYDVCFVAVKTCGGCRNKVIKEQKPCRKMQTLTRLETHVCEETANKICTRWKLQSYYYCCSSSLSCPSSEDHILPCCPVRCVVLRQPRLCHFSLTRICPPYVWHPSYFRWYAHI